MEYNAQKTHLYDYLDILGRRKWLVIAAFLVTLLSTLVHTFIAVPIYEASMTIQIEEKKGPRFSLSEHPIIPDFQQFDPLKTEAEIIKSSTIIGRLLEKMQLDEELTQVPLEERIGKFQEAIKVNPVRNTNILKISFQDEDPERAANILNGLSHEYIEQSLSIARAEATQAKEFLQRQLQTVKTELDNSQSAMEGFKSREGVTILSDDMKSKLDKLSEVEMKRVQIEMERKGLETILLSLENNRDLALTEISMSNSAIAEFARRLAELQVQKASMVNYYTEEHPSTIKVNAAIKETKIGLKEEAEKAVSVLKGKEKALKEIINRFEKDIKKLPKAEQELTNIMRNLKVSEGIYAFLLENEKKAEITEASEVGNIKVIDPAITPHKPIKPKKMLNSILGAIVGLCLGVGLSFFMEYMDDTIKGRDEIERYLDLPLFGILPLIGYEHGILISKKRSIESHKSLLLTIPQRSSSYIGESYRTLRTNIQFSEMEKRNQVILITSPMMGEGKSLTAANLASVFASDGAKALIIDADLRRPVQHKIFCSPQEPGLTNILMGRVNWLDAIVRPVGIETLSLIPSGPIPPNPSELLGMSKLDELLVTIKGLFDIIIIDTTPIIGLTDAIVLGPKVDGIFIVIEVEKTPVKLAMQAKDSLKMVKANIIGAILNKVPVERNSYGYGYGYNYLYYHGDGKDAEEVSFLKKWLNMKKNKNRTNVDGSTGPT